MGADEPPSSPHKSWPSTIARQHDKSNANSVQVRRGSCQLAYLHEALRRARRGGVCGLVLRKQPIPDCQCLGRAGLRELRDAGHNCRHVRECACMCEQACIPMCWACTSKEGLWQLSHTRHRLERVRKRAALLCSCLGCERGTCVGKTIIHPRNLWVRGSNLTGGHNRLSCPRSADTALKP